MSPFAVLIWRCSCKLRALYCTMLKPTTRDEVNVFIALTTPRRLEGRYAALVIFLSYFCYSGPCAGCVACSPGLALCGGGTGYRAIGGVDWSIGRAGGGTYRGAHRGAVVCH